ncbi:MAG: succinate--CoA ligase subunit alpha [Candidatus Magasanikbacteria bacterium CG10_big_fil_rev_8_21_14_0_10_40_10]|uniref:Succinate--CoA ligase subunit alpha n=1 Tax=Candidatus Magasanikbacteria bacterium CG10_big_fil_rev_8_21_14_0_10_40_10 TaxID=1974648 RepID=A0A2M6W4H1_9BACT|nr:MAG: succinate--CoA ligase subunit alpha [Candidatus Magasanikbacteria bacterium CG10_big_fil_rev_8_21_14_0_10_40_10]
MSILIDQNTRVLVQGITGKEGQRATQAMLDYGTKVVAGVRPGKGGEKVLDVPVFNSVAEAARMFPDINTSAIYVPPFAAKDAIKEAIDNNIKFINTIAERVPIRDTAYCLAMAKEKDIRLIGPSSLGYISPGFGRIGVVGGPLVEEIFKPGSVGAISRSGGMTNELAWQIRQAGLGQSTVVHVGGDLLMGTTYADLLKMFEQDEQTKVVIIFGEHGGSYEFEIVDLIKNRQYTKPLAIYIGGKFASVLPQGMNIGHAGAIVERGKGAKEKEKALSEVGVLIADTYEELAELAKPYA